MSSGRGFGQPGNQSFDGTRAVLLRLTFRLLAKVLVISGNVTYFVSQAADQANFCTTPEKIKRMILGEQMILTLKMG